MAPAALYSAFDRFPSPKGAATHIEQMATTLFDHCGGGVLHVLGDVGLPTWQCEGAIRISRPPIDEPNFLRRAISFSQSAFGLVKRHPGLRVAQFRDPFSGTGIMAAADSSLRLVYEVNGLPSIELPHLFPGVAASTLERIRAQERLCWERADLIVTPAATIAENLVRLGAPAQRIEVVPNGAEVWPELPRPASAPDRYLIYVGGLHRWQGIDVLLRAFARLRDLDVDLVILSSHEAKKARAAKRLARRLGIAERIIWRYRLQRRTVAAWLQHALISVAPLTACARNLDQGCCPLKIIESLAVGTAVVASDLPAIRELIRPHENGLLFAPDRPDALSRTLRAAIDFPGRTRALGQAGRADVVGRLQWSHARDKMTSLLHQLERPGMAEGGRNGDSQRGTSVS